MRKLGFLILIGLLPVGCAAMQQAWKQQYCNRDGAYAEGMNQARQGREMDPRFGFLCEGNDQEMVRAAYREGYTAGAGTGTVRLTVAANDVRSSPDPERQCVRAYGKEACGYGCLKAYGDVRCGANPGDTCVEAYGKLKCGRNCRKEYGDIVCD